MNLQDLLQALLSSRVRYEGVSWLYTKYALYGQSASHDGSGDLFHICNRSNGAQIDQVPKQVYN